MLLAFCAPPHERAALFLCEFHRNVSSSAGFFASFRRKGLRDNLLIVGMLIIAALAVVGVQYAFGLRPTLAAGLFAGSLTNTPVLAAVLEQIRIITPTDARDQLLADPVVGYSIAYPIGVIGMIIPITILQRVWHIIPPKLRVCAILAP